MAKYVKLPEEGYVVFVGDTHGDYDTSKIIVNNFINKKNYYMVMLGDYVDRGKNSKKNLNFLLETKKKHKNLILLAGNHETHFIREYRPSDFWSSLTPDEKEIYKKELLNLPLAATGKGFIALHGALPQIKTIEDINLIQNGDKNWESILWGDFKDKAGGEFGVFLGRPKFGKDYFESVMSDIGKNVLIRGHDASAPERMFNNRCLTLFTSAVYKRERKIALCDLGKEIKNIDDLEIISLDKPEI